jgi:choline dehydrogenase-like flavoprotein
MLPRFDNTVTVDRRRTDAWGIPVARIDCAFGPNEKAMIASQVAMLERMAAAAGLTVRMPPSGNLLERIAFRTWRNRLLAPGGAFLPGTAAHELGGAGMGDDPKRFVLNRFNQCWDAPNTFVTDGACFVSGCCQNTTLTIMALTARACHHLAREYRAGSLQATSASS